MADAIIAGFRRDFDFFWGMLEKQMARCPEDLWAKKAGGFLFWQQMLHVFAAAELFTLPEGAPSKQTAYDRGVVLLVSEPETTMSKEDLLALAETLKAEVHAFIGRQTLATLGEKHTKLSAVFGMELTNQNAITMLITHLAYHLGSGDAIFREHGIPGIL